MSCASFLGYTHEAEEPGRAPCDAPFVKSFKTTERSQRTLFHCLVLSADATIREVGPCLFFFRRMRLTNQPRRV